MEYTFRIKRYNPDVDVKPTSRNTARSLRSTDRVLDGLNNIKWDQDGSLTYRRSCAHGVCGSDAVRINGRNYLACKTLMKEFGKKITVEPLIGYKVVKDLVVDMDPFFDAYKSVKPYLIAGEAPAGEERRQTPEQVGAVRKRDQVHPLCRLHHILPHHLDERELRWPGCYRERWPLHLRQPGRGRRRALTHPEHAVGRMALPDRLQLHGSVPARYRGHEDHRGRQAHALA